MLHHASHFLNSLAHRVTDATPALTYNQWLYVFAAVVVVGLFCARGHAQRGA
jgi:hypothetical protein